LHGKTPLSSFLSFKKLDTGSGERKEAQGLEIRYFKVEVLLNLLYF